MSLYFIMSKDKPNKNTLPSTTDTLAITEIKENCVVMKDGSLRAVLLCSSVNFALKSEDEQAATIQAYVGFLNSTDFPVQIVIQSRKLNIDGYLEKLDGLVRQQTNELLRVQMNDYMAYIKELLSLGDIMSKRFFMVVPYYPGEDKRRKFMQRLMSILSAAGTVKLSRADFEHFAESLEQRVGYVSSGLSSVGITTARLDTQGLIELYYTTYNPDLTHSQKLAEVGKLQVESS